MMTPAPSSAAELELEDLDLGKPSEYLHASTSLEKAADSLTYQLRRLIRAEMVSGPWRRAIGLILLGTTVTLWTASGFLASSVFADGSYSKPYFVTWFNTASYILTLGPFALQQISKWHGRKYQGKQNGIHETFKYDPLNNANDVARASTDSEILASHSSHLNRRRSNDLMADNTLPDPSSFAAPHNPTDTQLTTRETFWLAFRFSLLWFASNYFNSASLQYTTVASTTILSSTTSVFTLIVGALWRVERFTWRKLLAVIVCLLGVFIISRADKDEDSRDEGRFPHKTPRELLVGDAMALVAAMLYGLYAVAFVKVVGDESRVRMPLFFGFMGVVTIVLLWPGMAVLHWTRLEPFSWPQDAKVWTVVVTNAVASLVADIAWAYALLFITPLVVTVGLSLTIPLSLVGQMIINAQYASFVYWVGSLIVLSSFVFINYESKPVQEHREGSDENG